MSPRIAPHTHPCQLCGEPVECGGTWEQNHDGMPEVICREFHVPGGGANPDYQCEDCDDEDGCIQRLTEAADRALTFFRHQAAGEYNSPHEDILCGEALVRALKPYQSRLKVLK